MQMSRLWFALLFASLLSGLIVGGPVLRSQTVRTSDGRQVAAGAQIKSARPTNHAPVVPPAQTNAVTTAKPALKVFTWREVETDQYRTYLAKLREAGCPEDKIQQIIVADVNDLFAQRRQEFAVAHDHEWWRLEPDSTLVLVFEEKRQSLAEERNALLKKLLSQALPETEAQESPGPLVVPLTGPVLGRLPRKTYDTVQEICARSQERFQTLWLERQNEQQPPTQVDLAKLRDQTRSDLTPILSATELEEFLLRYSHNSVELRNELRGFELTGDEFRKIFHVVDPIKHQMQLEYGGKEMLSPKQQEQFERQKDLAVQRVLSLERYQAYLLHKDPLFRHTQLIALQIGAATNAIVALYQIRKQNESKRKQITGDTSLTPEQRGEALKIAQQEQQLALKKLLGDDIYQRYVQFGYHLN
jgi:hypothetical protein